MITKHNKIHTKPKIKSNEPTMQSKQNYYNNLNNKALTKQVTKLINTNNKQQNTSNTHQSQQANNTHLLINKHNKIKTKIAQPTGTRQTHNYNPSKFQTNTKTNKPPKQQYNIESSITQSQN